jgi:F0F1-type ATP synthase assembly protein I
MVRLPRDITPGQAARRALLADLVIAIVVAVAVLSLTAGLGIAAVIALPTLLIVLAWIGIEAAVHRVARRRRLGANEEARQQERERAPAAEELSER